MIGNSNSIRKIVGPKSMRPFIPGRMKGFTMIEVLIAFLVLAIGLVGMASLQLTSVQSAHSSYLRSIASSIALDMEEQLWLEVADLGPSDDCPTISNVVATTKEIWSGQLNGTSWANSNHGIVTLPNMDSTGSISSTGTAYGDDAPDSNVPFWREVTFSLSWAEKRFEGEGSLEQFDYTARVICRPEPATI